jgi:sialate O-acetylesterase
MPSSIRGSLYSRGVRRKSVFTLSLGFACLTLMAMSSSTSATVTLPAVISDNMGLQQGAEVAIWGTADPGEQVTVTFRDQDVVGTADREGRWKVKVGPLKVGGPSEMTVAGKNTLTVHNVAVGEVWLCSGQSNMEMVVEGSVHAETEIAAANYPMIRHFTVQHAVASRPQNDVKGKWVVCSPKTVDKFSAVAYFFGRELHRVLGVPVGLIDSSVGGTPAEAWTSRSALEADPELRFMSD